MKRLLTIGALLFITVFVAGCAINDWAWSSVNDDKERHQAMLDAIAKAGTMLSEQHAVMAPDKFDELEALKAELESLIAQKKAEGDRMTSPLNNILDNINIGEILALFGFPGAAYVGKRWAESSIERKGSRTGLTKEDAIALKNMLASQA